VKPKKKKKKKNKKKKNKRNETEAQATSSTTTTTTTTSEEAKRVEKGNTPLPAAQVEVKKPPPPSPPPEPTLLDLYRETVEKQTEKKIYEFCSKEFIAELKKRSSVVPKMENVVKNVGALGAVVVTAYLCSLSADDLIKQVFASAEITPTNYVSTPNLILEQFDKTVDDYAYFYTFIRVPISTNAAEDITHRISMIKDKDRYFIVQAYDEKYGLEEQLKQYAKIFDKNQAVEFWKNVIAAVDKKEAWETVTTVKNDFTFLGEKFPKRRRVFFFIQKFDKQTFVNTLRAIV